MGLLHLVCLGGLVWAEAPSRQPVTATDLLKIRRITGVQLAPDSSFAIYSLLSIHSSKDDKGDESYAYRSHIWYVDLTHPASQPRQLTFGDWRDFAITLSPDGKTLAFIRELPGRPNQEPPKPQAWLLPVAEPGEARQVTHLEDGAAGPVWHPNGRQLLVSSPIAASKIEGAPHYGYERPARQWRDSDPASPANPDGDRRAVRNWLERNASRNNPTVITRLNYQDEQSLRKQDRVFQLFHVDVTAGDKLTQLTRDFYSHTGYSYSPAGRHIVSISSPRTPEHPDRVRRNAVWLMNSDGSGARTLLDDAGENPTAAAWYPDSGAILITTQRFDEPTFRQARLLKMEVESGHITPLAEGWDSAVNDAMVSSDGTVLFTTHWHGGTPLKRVTAHGLSDLVQGPVGVTDFDEAAGRVVYSQISVANPHELYLREKDGAVRQLTNHNGEWLASKLISLPTEKWIQRPDGSTVQSWVMNPVHAQSGRRYPFVLDMHGGPHAMWGPGEFSMWHEFQLLCAAGFGVVYANPRGSSGYGYAFQKGNFRDWGTGPAGDVLAALDDALATNPFADKDRLFLTGGSYAGYLTAWIVSHDHRFKAAASQRGVYDLNTFYGEGNAYTLVKHSFGGRPFDPETRKLLEAQSPFTYVKEIRTPLLILHGSDDLRTGVSQSEMMYRALKDLGKPVEYVRYPGAGHELTRSGNPLQRMDHMLRIIEFFERYNPAP